MLVDLKDNRLVLVRDTFAEPLVLNRQWGLSKDDVRVFARGKQLTFGSEYFLFASPDGESDLLELADKENISIDGGAATITTRGSEVLEYLSTHPA
ncbi:MAG: hypothetical protein ACRD4O_10745 [Bryobacteraceae bacterium]